MEVTKMNEKKLSAADKIEAIFSDIYLAWSSFGGNAWIITSL